MYEKYFYRDQGSEQNAFGKYTGSASDKRHIYWCSVTMDGSKKILREVPRIVLEDTILGDTFVFLKKIND